MTIHFSPFYTANCFTGLERGMVTFNEVTVNETGLLAQLELRLGLSRPDTPPTHRLPDYYKAMRQVMNDNKGKILEESWKVDALGTAKKCLEWRDALVMSGWTADMKQPSERLKLLAEIERKFGHKDALGDRWQEVVKALEENTPFASDMQVKVGLKNKNALQPLMVHVLELLAAKDVSIEYTEMNAMADTSSDLGQLQQALLHRDKDMKLKDDGSLRVLRFSTESEAARYLVAMHEKNPASLYIAKRDVTMNYAELMMGKPTSGCAVSCETEHELQLLPLAVEQWAYPYNVRSLMQWLQVAVHPLTPMLRKGLMYALSSEGGRDGKSWKDAIDAFHEKADEETKQKMDERMEWALPYNKENVIKKEAFESFMKQLKEWVDGRRHIEARKDTMLTHQLASLSEALDVMLQLIKDTESETLDFEQLQKWAATLYDGGEHDMAAAQVGSMNIIAHPGDILSGVDSLTWTDCYNATPSKVDSDFFNSTERKGLKEQGCCLTGQSEMLEAEQQAQIAALMHVKKQLTLVMADENIEGATNMHPLVIKLKQMVGKDAWDKLVEKPVIDEDLLTELPTVHNEKTLQSQINIKNGNMLEMADHESYSSLTNLVNHPVDYLLGRILKLDTMQEESIGELATTTGTVAHRVIQNLFKGSVDEIAAAIENSYEDTFDDAVSEKGALLLLPENTLERLRMRMVLRQSVDTLLDIIRENELTVVKTEMDIDGDFYLDNTEKLLLKGQADMVLERKDGTWVVFDFKWSTSKTWYENLLKEDSSLQLAIYKEMLSKKPDDDGQIHEVVATAYYQLPLCQMHTQYNILKGKRVNLVKPKDPKDLITQLRNSYVYRSEQFTNGKIDNGDLLEIEKTDYGKDQADKDLLTLETDYANKKLKSANSFTHFPLFKTPLK